MINRLFGLLFAFLALCGPACTPQLAAPEEMNADQLSWSLAAGHFNTLIVGDSNVNSTRVDTTWDCAPTARSVQTGFTFIDTGVEQTTYPCGFTPGVGMVPWLIEGALDREIEDGWIIRRGANGATSVSYTIANSHWDLAQNDVSALNQGDPDVVVIVLGANDGHKIRSQAYAERFYGNVLGMIEDANTNWPSAIVMLAKESISPSGLTLNYIRMDSVIYPAIDQLAVDTDALVIDGRNCSRVDAVHWSVTGIGQTPAYGGQQCVSDLIWSALDEVAVDTGF